MKLYQKTYLKNFATKLQVRTVLLLMMSLNFDSGLGKAKILAIVVDQESTVSCYRLQCIDE